jgi:hypothetical protein
MKIATFLGTIGIICALVLNSEPAQAQNSISFVSGTGSDSNPCTRTLPCATFQRAHDQTDSGGFVNCLDPGSFGPVNFARSITIDCSNTFANMATPDNIPVVDINTTGLSIILRGLSIASAGAGQSGISIQGGGTVQVERSKIAGSNLNSNANSQFGIIGGNGAMRLSVTDTIISANLGAIAVGNCVATLVSLRRMQLVRNQNLGLDAEAQCDQASSRTRVTVIDSIATLNGFDGFRALATPLGAAGATIEIQRSTASLNGSGVNSFGARAQIVIGSTMLTGNTFGFETVNGGAITSYRNNAVDNNTTNGTPTGTINPM